MIVAVLVIVPVDVVVASSSPASVVVSEDGAALEVDNVTVRVGR